MIVWFDMDGVTCDFDGEYMRLTGRPTWYGDHQKSHDEKWDMIMKHPNFFRDLPWMKGARALFNFVRYSRVATPGILSAASSHIEKSDEHKRIWLDNELPELMWTPDLVKIVAHKKEKAQYAKTGDILIDDFEANIKAWREAGGIGILFKSAAQAISELQEYMKTDEKFFKLALACAENDVTSSVYFEMYMLEQNERLAQNRNS